MTSLPRKPLSRFPEAALASLLLFCASGCGGVIVQISSKPQGATIYINGEEKGVTPMQKVLLPFSGDALQPVFIQLSKPGYKPSYSPLRINEVPDERKLFIELTEI